MWQTPDMSQTKLLELWGGGEGKVPLSAKGGSSQPAHSKPSTDPPSKIPPGSWRLRTIRNSLNQHENGGVHFFIDHKLSSGCPSPQGQYLGCPGLSGAWAEDKPSITLSYWNKVKSTAPSSGLAFPVLITLYLLSHLFPQSTSKRTSRSFQKFSPVPFDFVAGLSVFNFNKFPFHSHQTHRGKQAA